MAIVCNMKQKHGGKIKWTDDMIKSFWAFRSEHTSIEYSADKLSNRLLELVDKYVPSSGYILDVGFGSGALLNQLDGRGYDCSGIDLSESSGSRADLSESVALYYGSVFDTQFDKKFDVIFLMDVLEHLPDDDVVPRLRYIKTLLSDKGVLIMTTPSNEDFEKALVYCPVCQSVFHEHQHVHTWRVPEIQQICDTAGLDIMLIKEVKEHTFIESKIRRFIFSIYYALMKVAPKKTILVVATRDGGK